MQDSYFIEENGERRKVQTHELHWLPPEGAVPSNVRFVLSSLPGLPVDVLKGQRNDIDFRHTLPLHKNERRDFIEAVLHKHSKHLTKRQISQLLYSETQSITLLPRFQNTKPGFGMCFAPSTLGPNQNTP